MKNLSFILLFLILTVAGHGVAQQSETPRTYRFQIGEQVLTRTPPGDNLRLRTAPHTDADIVVNMASGLRVTVVGGPEITTVETETQDTEGQTVLLEREETWWQIEVPGGESTGWALGSVKTTNRSTREVSAAVFLLPVPAVPAGTGANCDLAPTPQLVVGDEAMVEAEVYLPVYEDPGSPVKQAELAGRQTFTVLSGPYCGLDANHYWYIAYGAYGDEAGYVQETADGQYVTRKLNPDLANTDTRCPGAATQNLVIGQQAIANPELIDPMNVRTRPTFTGIDAFLLYPAETVTVTDGPLCYPFNGQLESWWRVENERGVNGWVAEATGRTYQLQPYVAVPTPTIDAACIVTTLSGVNLRSGAGSTFEAVGSAQADASFGAVRQAQAEDGTMWWELLTGEWVAASMVTESDGCNIPGSTPEILSTATSDASGDAADTIATPTPGVPTVSPDAACVLTTLQGVNFRAQPSAEAEKIGSVLADTVLEADGQFTGADGFVWWRLVAGQGWVRQDLVAETDGCSTLPVIEQP